jgi:hypothetical protein
VGSAQPSASGLLLQQIDTQPEDEAEFTWSVSPLTGNSRFSSAALLDGWRGAACAYMVFLHFWEFCAVPFKKDNCGLGLSDALQETDGANAACQAARPHS